MSRIVCQFDHGITSMDDLSRVEASIEHREFMNEIGPLLKIKTDMLSLKVPTIIIRDGNSLPEVTYSFTESEKKLLSDIDDRIQIIAKKYGLTMPPAKP